MQTILFLIVGLIAQFIDGTLGMGYGVSSATILISFAIMPAVVSASVHTAKIFTTLLSGVSHIKLGNFRKDIFWPLVMAGIVGGVCGAILLSSIAGNAAQPFIAFILLALGATILLRFLLQKNIVGIDSKISHKYLLPVGFIAAFVDAIGGGGWGPVATPALILSNKSSPRKVIGTVNTAEFFVAIAISATFMFSLGLQQFLWPIVVSLVVGGVIAAPVAAFFCKRLPARVLGIAVGVLLILLNSRTLLLAFIFK